MMEMGMQRLGTLARSGRLAIAVALFLPVTIASAATPTFAARGLDGSAPRPTVEIAEISTGFHTCVRFDDGRLKCWGSNGDGELGFNGGFAVGDAPGEMGASLPFIDLGAGRAALAVSAGRFHTCVLLDDGSIKCFGSNRFGQLGYGTTTSMGMSGVGDQYPTVDLGTGRTATAISSGVLHTCAILDDGSVKCWGSNFVGRLGLGDTEDRGDQPGEMGDNLPSVDLGAGRSAVELSAAHVSELCASR